MSVLIRSLTKSDWPQVRTIYEQGLKTRMATFETNSPDWRKWTEAHTSHSRWVACKENIVLGWVALTPVSGRCVYEGVAEVSIYVDEAQKGRQIGSQLMQKVIGSSEEKNIWTLQASMFPENHASINLHKKFGFREVGIREKIGRLDGQWRDTLLMERRSSVI